MITSYKTLPLGKYLDILDILEDDHTDDVSKRVAVLSILTGKTEDELETMPIMQFAQLSSSSRFLENEIPTLSRPIKHIKAGDYAFNVTTDVKRLSTAQYVDFNSFASDARHKLVEILSCFLIPEGCSYNEGYDIEDVQNCIRENLNVVDAVAISAFFLSSLTQLLAAIQLYSQLQMKLMPRRLKKQMKMNTPANGAGSER